MVLWEFECFGEGKVFCLELQFVWGIVGEFVMFEYGDDNDFDWDWCGGSFGRRCVGEQYE